jgi:hypothetical protein
MAGNLTFGAKTVRKKLQTQNIRFYFNLHDILVKNLCRTQYLVHFPVDKRI